MTTIPTLTNFTIPTKRYGDASFNLIDPSSNSPGSFTFSSGSPSIATISGRTVTIVGIGSSVITATQAASGIYTTNNISAVLVVTTMPPTLTNFTIPIKRYGDASFNLIDPSSNSPGSFTFSSGSPSVATISGRTVTIVNFGSSVITATQAASGSYAANDISAVLIVTTPPTWYPNLIQNTSTGALDIIGTAYTGDNTYTIWVDTTFTLAQVDVDRLPPLIRGQNLRPTGIGVLPMIIMTSTNQNPDCPILYDCSENRYAVSIFHLNNPYYTAQQLPVNDPRYDSQDLKAYKDVIVINGLISANNTILYNQDSITVNIHIKQGAGIWNNIYYAEKIVHFPFTITKVATNISLRSINLTPLPLALLGNNGSGYTIQREYLQASMDLSYSMFATTNRQLLNGGGFDYTNIIYYLTQPSRDVFTFQNDHISITENRITFLSASYSYNPIVPNDNPVYDEIPILFFQEASASYKRSQFIGDPIYSPPLQRTTIKLRIVKSMPTFKGQTPEVNSDVAGTVYTLPDISKMTYDDPFEIIPPLSNNTDASDNFVISSSNPDIVKIKIENGKHMAYIYNAGNITITVTQTTTRNFNAKTATFLIYVNLISPSLINCNTNVVYTNPYQRQFWTRFKPACPDYNFSIKDAAGVTRKLTAPEVDDLYSERRKTEILKYSKNVGGLTKSQKYAKAMRGELMRQIGNESKYLTGANGSTLLCPSQPSRVLCGLTSACGVPGKERVLCYDPSINVYNLTRTYEYKGGQQTVSNIPTLALTQPRNLVADVSDNNRIILTWDSPISNGGLAITGYVISYSLNNKIWAPYTSLFPNKNGPIDELTGERNGNTVIFQDISGSIVIKSDTVYYISVFSANERGLSSVPATVSVKTTSVPTIITDFGLFDVDRKFLSIDLKWTDPINVGSSGGGYNGPAISQYQLQYKTSTDTSWTKILIDILSVVSDTANPTYKKYTLRNISNEKTYSIKIEPINKIGTGPESKIITARTLMKPGPPINIVIISRYGVPPASTGAGNSKINYITVTWDKPDTGGSNISSYNITITGFETKFYPVVLSSTQTSYTYYITTLNSKFIDIGTYSLSLTAKNSNFTSESSIVSSITILPITSKMTIVEPININYNGNTITNITISFLVETFNYIDNPITNIKVSGLGDSGNDTYETLINIDNQTIVGTGKHTIVVPTFFNNVTLIRAGNSYTISVNAQFGGNAYSSDTKSENVLIQPSIRV